VSYTYDVLGRRQSRTSNGQTVAWLYRNALKPIAQFVIDPTTGASLIDQLYIYGSSALTPDALLTYDNAGAVAGVYRIITDARGSVRLVVDAVTGEIEQQLNYGPFGEVLYDSNPGFQPFGYAGGIYDADTGLVRFGARDYDAETGRWLSRDPIGFAGGDANLYAYVGGDPVNGVDPTGLDGVDLSAELEAGLFFARSALAAFSLGPFWSEAEIASDLKTGAFGRRDSMFRDGLIQASRNRIARESMDGMYGALTCADHYLESFEGATDFGAGAMRMRVDGYGWLKWMPFFDPPRSNTDIPPTRRYPETYRAALAGIGDARALGLANPENEYWLAVQTGLGR
jgi:RHS repeat-associated protein